MEICGKMLTVGHCATLSTFLYASKCSYKNFEISNSVFVSVFMVHNIPLRGKKKETFSSGRHKKAKKT